MEVEARVYDYVVDRLFVQPFQQPAVVLVFPGKRISTVHDVAAGKAHYIDPLAFLLDLGQAEYVVRYHDCPIAELCERAGEVLGVLLHPSDVGGVVCREDGISARGLSSRFCAVCSISCRCFISFPLSINLVYSPGRFSSR